MPNISDTEADFEYVKRAFGCGTSFHDFRAAFYALDEENKERLARVAWRAWVTLMLRYRLDVASPDAFRGLDEFWRSRNEWHSLELYLLVTCFDTLAGKAKHLPFEDWLEQHHTGGSLELQEVVASYKHYQEEYGVRRNLKRTFSTLPYPAKKWVTNVIRLLKDSERFTHPDEFDLGVDAQVTRLFNRFFEFRNQYTHSSVATAPLVSELLSATPERNKWKLSLFPIVHDPQQKPGKHVTLCLRGGIDEATVLRILLVVVACSMLGIPVSENLIRANVEKFARVDALYRFMYELTANAGLYHWMFSEKAYWYSLWKGLPTFSTERTEALMNRLWDNPLESGLREWLQRYHALLQSANADISTFNNSHSAFDNRNIIEVTQAARSRRIQEIGHFLRLHEQTWKPIIEITTSNEAANLWLVVRDPCYS